MRHKEKVAQKLVGSDLQPPAVEAPHLPLKLQPFTESLPHSLGHAALTNGKIQAQPER